MMKRSALNNYIGLIMSHDSQTQMKKKKTKLMADVSKY